VGNAGSGGEHQPPLTIFTEQILLQNSLRARISSPANSNGVLHLRSYHQLIYVHQSTEGGHFSAWEQPKLLAAGLRGVQTIALVWTEQSVLERWSLSCHVTASDIDFNRVGQRQMNANFRNTISSSEKPSTS